MGLMTQAGLSNSCLIWAQDREMLPETVEVVQLNNCMRRTTSFYGTGLPPSVLEICSRVLLSRVGVWQKVHVGKIIPLVQLFRWIPTSNLNPETGEFEAYVQSVLNFHPCFPQKNKTWVQKGRNSSLCLLTTSCLVVIFFLGEQVTGISPYFNG